MRVFVLCAGRTGSVTFTKACNHINNYTNNHEKYSDKLGDARIEIPNNHIEVDNRLSWFVGELDEKYGDEAFYVHLKRNRKKVAESHKKRIKNDKSIINAYSKGIKLNPPEDLTPSQRKQVAVDYVNTVESNVRLLFKNKKNTLTLNLENIEEEFPIFWEEINAKGNLSKALDVFNEKHNPSNSFQLKNVVYSMKSELKRLYFKLFIKP